MRTILPRFRQQLARGMLGWVRKYLSRAVFSSTEWVTADFLSNTVAHCSISFVFNKNYSNFD
jgi:hypothetical protein